MRVVIDTNILVSALISASGNPATIYNAWVSAANTVTVQACDIMGTQKTAGTGSIRIDLWKH